MRIPLLTWTALAMTLPVAAALTSVEVGGELRIRGRANVRYQNSSGTPARVLIPDGAVRGRPIGAAGLGSRYRFDHSGEDRNYVEMESRLHVAPEFSDGVSAYMEFETSGNWGTSFRSDPITGLDRRGEDSIHLFQAYAEAEDFLGLPVRMRLGRQTLKMGKGWLVGDRISGVLGVSFDGLRATYKQDHFTVDAWWSKLAENLAGDDDEDFYGIYATYDGLARAHISLFWMLVRDSRALEQTNLAPAVEWLEDVAGLDDYGTTNLHTAGMRIWGEYGAADYDWELAYQFGDAEREGFGFVPVGGIYGDDDAHFGAFATDFEAGYTFDARFSPRVYAGGAWYEGEDHRTTGPLAWLNPLQEGEASVSFNRLFADTTAKYFLILDGGQVLSNFKAARAGVELEPSEKTTLQIELEQFWVDAVFQRPRFPGPFLTFLTEPSSDDLGVQFLLTGRYAITPDCWVRLRYEHLFAGKGIADGNFSDRDGLNFLQGSDHVDADYIEVMLGLGF